MLKFLKDHISEIPGVKKTRFDKKNFGLTQNLRRIAYIFRIFVCVYCGVLLSPSKLVLLVVLNYKFDV